MSEASNVAPPSPEPTGPEPDAQATDTTAQPRGGVRGFVDRHPMLLAWIALSVGMVAILLYTSRDVGLQPSQTFAMVVATIALAGACVWIITWD